MHDSHGELLIGGLRLHNVHVELEQEEPQPGHCDWIFSGRIHVTPEEAEKLDIERHYLLQLEDGRAGPIVLTKVEETNGTHLAVFRSHT